MQHTQETPSMTVYPISTDAIEYYTDAHEQFEQLLGRLMCVFR